ncbi:MAG: triose-phosphate isomerase [Pseudomonadota bacterium]
MEQEALKGNYEVITMKKLIAGNWKMNGTIEAAIELAESIENGLEKKPELQEKCDVLVCPPLLHLLPVSGSIEKIALGAQDCSQNDNGAFTGDVSTAMLKDIGAGYVILGHSERRQYHNETDELVAQKATKANEAGLITIICVGETESEREAGKEQDIVGAQLAASMPEGCTPENTVIAYEPVWAIGTGKTATAEDVAVMHAFIREKVGEGIRILYGGSMKPANAAELLATPNVDGGLIGGASLKAEDFLGIAQAA